MRVYFLVRPINLSTSLGVYALLLIRIAAGQHTELLVVCPVAVIVTRKHLCVFKAVFFFVLLQSYLHQLLSFGYVILPSIFHAEKTHMVQPKSFLNCPKEKLYMAMHWKFIPSLFQPKNREFYSLKNRKFTKCSKIAEKYPQKENRQRPVRSSACCSIYFQNRNRIMLSRFRLFCFVTVLIPVSVRTLPSSAEQPTETQLWTPATRACRKLLHPLFQTFQAEPFVVLWG